MHQNALKSDVWLILVTLLAGLGWVFSTEALTGMTPLFFIGSRFLLAGFILAGFGWTALRRLSAQDWRYALMTGVVMGLALTCWILGLSLSDNIGIGAFIASLVVVFIPVVGKFLFGASTGLSTWVAVGVSLVGLAFLRVEGGFALTGSDLFFLMAAMIFSVHFNLNTRLSARIPALPMTAVQLGITGVVALSLAALLEPAPVRPGVHIFGWLLASVLIATCLRFWLQIKAQGLATASHAAVIMTLEPVWASLLGWVWYEQQMTVLQYVGCGLIFSALLISRWRVLLRGSSRTGQPAR